MSVQILSNSEFISKIIQDSDTGRCFVPLVGSGLSSPSGIIMGMEFTNYLAFTTYLVLSHPQLRERTYGEGIPMHWDLRHQGWPPLPSNDEVERTRRWLLAEFKNVCKRYDLDINYEERTEKIRSITPKQTRPPSHELLASFVHPQVPSILAAADLIVPDESVKKVADVLIRRAYRNGNPRSAEIDLILTDSSRSYRQRIVETGIRSLHDWRETLVFLSSVVIENGALTFGPSVNSVIDRFNSTITRDKQPNLGHKMLAHLSGPLRIQSILTTNFDSLIEDAFRALSFRVRVLPVSSKGTLPEPQTVGADFSVVKLHGEVQDTRADMTLDDEPSDEDKQTFVDYLTRGSGNLRRVSPAISEAKRLLVIGYSGSDYRCIQMIKHWLEHGREGSRLRNGVSPGQLAYWICFSNSDTERVKRLFSASEYNDRIRVTQTTRPDLLLYELYQRLVLSLPPGGLTYEFSHVVPPRRLKIFDYPEQQIENVLACSKTVENPLEASRVLLSESSSLDDARRLHRDASVMELKQLVLDSIHERLSFYDQNGKYQPKQFAMTTAALWSPVYQGLMLVPKDKETDDERLYGGFNSRPIIIDSLGGCVRGVSMAVDQLTAISPKKVFWIETQDYMDADALLRDLLRSIAVRFGSFQGRQVTQHPLSRSLSATENEKWKEAAIALSDHIKRVLTDYRIDANQVVVLLYGRDSYGSCSGLVPSPWGNPLESRPEDLSDSAQNSSFEELHRHFKPLHCVIEALGRAGVRTLYFPLIKDRADRKNQFPMGGSPKIWKISPPVEPSGNGKSQRDDREEWEHWEKTRNASDHWREWPFDPYATLALAPSSLNRAAKDVKDFNYHESAAGASVFQNIIEQILSPYFQFEEAPLSSNRNVAPIRSVPFTKGRYRKVIFLYGLTLFRHSRHINALCSEAVFHCPYRFNANAIDNDFLRSEEITRWIDELRSARIFFDKPGGSVWMHRDIRLTLQHFLEHLDFLKPSEEPGNGRTSSADANAARTNRNLRDMRSRLHFWIGDWYQKAFCSSGHLTPIIESVHHRVMAAIYAQFARYKTGTRKVGTQNVEYQGLLFESSLLEAQKTLHIAWNALKLWQPSALEVSWVGVDHRNRIEEALTKALEAICRSPANDEKWKARLTRARDGLIDCLAALNQELLLEGGGGETDENGYLSKNTSPRPSPINVGLSAYKLEPEDSQADYHQVPICLDHGWRAINTKSQAFDTQVTAAFRDPRVGQGATKLLGCIRRIGMQVAEPTPSIHLIVTELSTRKASWKANVAHNPVRLHDMIWLLGEFAYVMLRRAKLLYHANSQIAFPHWVQATIACNLGIDFCKHLPPWLLRYDIQSKVKLHSLYGVSLANIGRFFESSRHFNEGQALLSKMPDASPADLAVIMLRRAEALLTESLWISMFIPIDDQTQDPFTATSEAPPVRTENPLQGNIVESDPTLGPDFVRSTVSRKLLGPDTVMRLIDGTPDSETWSATLAASALLEADGKKVIAVPPRIAECLRKVSSRSCSETMIEKLVEKAKPILLQLYKSVLDEAVTLLDLAESNLSGHSQSSLWWSRMHTLRLRIYGLLHLLGDQASDCLILRKKSADQGIYESFRNSMRIAREDPFRKLRSVKYFFEADQWHQTFDLDQKTASGATDTRLPESFRDAVTALNLLEKRIQNKEIPSESLLGRAIHNVRLKLRLP